MADALRPKGLVQQITIDETKKRISIFEEGFISGYLDYHRFIREYSQDIFDCLLSNKEITVEKKIIYTLIKDNEGKFINSR